MRVYHERLRVPVSWWLLGLATAVLLATEVIAGWAWPIAVAIYVVLVGGLTAMLLNWGRPSLDVGGGELRAGRARLPLAEAGEVTALDEAQTRSLRGPRGDPAAFMLTRPYLRQAVYVEVISPESNVPYWLICTRHPAELATAINASRPASRADGTATMG
jgi:hypothetical protein